MVNALAALQLLDELRFFVAKFVRNDQRDGLADDFVRGIAEHARGTGIPRANSTVERLADNGVVRGLDDCRQQRDLDGCIGSVRAKLQSLCNGARPVGQLGGAHLLPLLFCSYHLSFCGRETSRGYRSPRESPSDSAYTGGTGRRSTRGCRSRRFRAAGEAGFAPVEVRRRPKTEAACRRPGR